MSLGDDDVADVGLHQQTSGTSPSVESLICAQESPKHILCGYFWISDDI